jgi:hypothetical protein
LRTVGDDYEPSRFSTWAAKAVAMIGRLPDTLADRSIVVPMRRRAPAEHVERLRLDRPGDFGDLTRRAARWVADTSPRCTPLTQRYPTTGARFSRSPISPADGDSLRVRGPRASMTPDIAQTLRDHRVELLALLDERE